MKNIKTFENFRSNTYSVLKGINNTQTNYVYGGVNDDGIGQFYTDNEIMAKFFAGLTVYDPNTEQYEDQDNDGEVKTVDIVISNPYIITSDDEDFDSVQEYFQELKDNGSVDEYRNHLISNGYDGIILKDCNTNYYIWGGTYTIYIVF